MHEYGEVSVSTSYFERKTSPNIQRDLDTIEELAEKDVGFSVSLGPEGTWESVRSLLPLSLVPKSLDGEFIAMEVVMKNGKKHVIFRSLVTVVNESDVKLDISLCHVSSVQGEEPKSKASSNFITEEIFENQRYERNSGWISSFSGSQNGDAGPWSTRNFSKSSKVSINIKKVVLSAIKEFDLILSK